MNCPNCNGNLYDSSELARAHAELLDAGRSVSVACAYCTTVHVRKPEGASHVPHHSADHGNNGPSFGHPIQSAMGAGHARGAGRAERDGHRQVTPLLGIGIFFAPYIFAWFTLQEGYSSRARWFSFGWLAFLIVSSSA